MLRIRTLNCLPFHINDLTTLSSFPSALSTCKIPDSHYAGPSGGSVTPARGAVHSIKARLSRRKAGLNHGSYLEILLCLLETGVSRPLLSARTSRYLITQTTSMVIQARQTPGCGGAQSRHVYLRDLKMDTGKTDRERGIRTRAAGERWHTHRDFLKQLNNHLLITSYLHHPSYSDTTLSHLPL